MDCKNAYLLNGVDYILCRKVQKPDAKDRKAVAHALCAHQKFCPQKGCHTMEAGWESCKRLISEAPAAPKPKKTKKTVK